LFPQLDADAARLEVGRRALTRVPMQKALIRASEILDSRARARGAPARQADRENEIAVGARRSVWGLVLRLIQDAMG
jgi:hypothetical protein